MTGKEKCRILKEIRREIALKNDIEWVVKECTHQGECKGTCPRCESEVRKLERELEIRRKIGKAVAIVGVSTACLAGLTACHSHKAVVDDLAGMIDVVEQPVDQNGNPYGADDPYGTDDPYGLNGDPYGKDEPFQLDGDVAMPIDVELDGEIASDDYGAN